MWNEFFRLLAGWDAGDTRIAIAGSLAAMSCALPGTWLFLRRQSLLGDALSHSVLPGIVLAYLAMYQLETRGIVHHDSGARHLVLFLGATLSGVLSAVATELIQRWGRMDRGAAIGVVFTTMFAFGLLLIRMFADKTHVDPSCVLYGTLETSVGLSGGATIPRATIVNGTLVVLNTLLVILFFKELKLSTFDPGLAGSVGLNANGIQIVLMAMTAGTLVAAFESVGAILVIAMLIVPPATARLLSDRLSVVLILSPIVAVASAVLGHAGARTLPKMFFSRLGYPEIEDASTTGMMAVASGCLFFAAIVASPRHGMIRRLTDQIRLQIRIAGEDILGALYRREESSRTLSPSSSSLNQERTLLEGIYERIARKRLLRRGLIEIKSTSVEPQLTNHGREAAKNLVRAHRLWEAYMARHFTLPGDHLHATAEKVEHYLSAEMQSELAEELDQPNVDPHGKSIPASGDQ